jgi:hypothetical protein
LRKEPLFGGQPRARRYPIGVSEFFPPQATIQRRSIGHFHPALWSGVLLSLEKGKKFW